MRSSSGEVRIFQILSENNIPFSEEYEFPDLISSSGRHLRFDFCVFDRHGRIAFLIEYQGRQHYLPVRRFGGEKGYHKQRINDRKKREYCILHGYNLVCVPYWDEDRLSLDYILKAAGYDVRGGVDGLR